MQKIVESGQTSHFRNKHCGSERFVHSSLFFIFVFSGDFYLFFLGILGFKGLIFSRDFGI